jgi:acyl dehydratase
VRRAEDTDGVTERRYFEDARIGDRIVTAGRTITETDLVLFAAFSGDWNALHTDAEAAARGPFGARIAHGMLTLVAGLNALFRGGPGPDFLPSALIALTALDRVRFVRPVKIGDTLRLDCEVVEMRRVLERKGTLELRCRVLSQRDETVMACRMTLLVACAGDAPPDAGADPAGAAWTGTGTEAPRA